MAEEYPYKEVHALFCFWDNSRSINFEMEGLESSLQNYALNSISQLHFRSSIKNENGADLDDIRSWIKKYSHPDHLLIFYCSGHGEADKCGRLTLYPQFRPAKDLIEDQNCIEWPSLYEALCTHSRSDILILMYCCDAAAAINDMPQDLTTSITVEIIMACGANELAGGPGVTFHTALVATLKKMAMNRHPFSAAVLARETASQMRRWKSRITVLIGERHHNHFSIPIYFRSHNGSAQRPILLKPSGVKHPIRQRRAIADIMGAENSWQK
ncbi:uncharacterized protein LY89DRAFT_688969 [Mollisia scopiformis]|uniref:Uncharacterized protein n=1 Tax=Mollisia scopiformis TaxID=149040 RepID=A0A194WTS2_MOLSC|nr:uncharacterized protein LY89DRAFT_688969 [Mollisia scopiformis]KUJ11007.1 hypothetical protein LY89DRAFT_688969 [Mollisia scopiformis]